MRIRLRQNALSECYGDLGISRDELARRMKVSSSAAWRVETGRVEPSPRFIAALINTSGKSFEDLFEVVNGVEEPVA